MQRKANGLGPRITLAQPNKIQRRIVQPKLTGKTPVETRPAPPVYRPQSPAVSKPASGTVMQPKINAGFRSETRPAPPVYRPSSNSAGVQAKVAENFGLETRPAPPVYRPQATDLLAQAKAQTVSVQAQSQYELSPAVWVGQGRQQIRIRAKGSPTQVGSVDVHFKQPGKAFISDLEVAQAHRKHGLGSMLMKAALDSARRQGSTATMLEANPGPGSISKQALVSMYQKLGFKNTGMSRKGNPMMTVQGKMAPMVNPMAVRQPKMASASGFSPNVLQPAMASDAEIHVESMLAMADYQGQDYRNYEWGTKTPFYARRDDQRPALEQMESFPFGKWLFYNGPPPTKMNCWEGVLYAAYRAGLIDKAYIRKAIHVRNCEVRFVTAVMQNSRRHLVPTGDRNYVSPKQLANEVIPKGDIVVFGTGHHVALSSGKTMPCDPEGTAKHGVDYGHGIIELDKAAVGIKESTVEDTLKPQYASELSWGPMPTLAQL